MKDVIGHIRNAVNSCKLKQPFRAAQVNTAIGIDYAGNYLAKHTKGDYCRIYFKRVSRGLYELI